MLKPFFWEIARLTMELLSVFEMLVKVLEEWSIADRQVVGLGSDGASVMTGRHNGVGV